MEATKLWDERGSGASQQASVWRPTTSKYLPVFFGDIFVAGSREPSSYLLMYVARFRTYHLAA